VKLRIGLDCAVFYVPANTVYGRLYGRRFLQVKGIKVLKEKAVKENNPKNRKKTKITHTHTHKIVDKYSVQL